MKILKRLYLIPCTIVLLTACLANYAAGQASSAPSIAPRPQGGPSGTAPGMPQVSRMQPINLAAYGGSMSNGVYTNSVYGFSIKTPPGWAIVPSRDPAPAKAQAGNPLLKSAQINHTLLAATENAPLRKFWERKSLQIIATHMVNQSTSATAHDYLIYSRNTAKEKGMKVEYLGDPEEVTINGQKLWKAQTNEEIEGRMQHVEQYVIMRESSLLQFFLMSPTDTGLKEIEPSIQSLQFKPLAPKRGSKHTSKSAKPANSTDTTQK